MWLRASITGSEDLCPILLKYSMKPGQQINPLVQPLVLGYQERAQKQNQEFQALQAHSKKLAVEFQKVVQQHHENEIVKKVASSEQDMDALEDEAKVYKLVGMVLVPQTLEEARSNVNSRIEFLTKGM